MPTQHLFLASSFLYPHPHPHSSHTQDSERLFFLTLSFDRLICSVNQPHRKTRNGPVPKALKSTALHPLIEESSPRSGFGTLLEREREIDIEREVLPSLPTGYWSEVLITELQRSLLENQWTLITHGQEVPRIGSGRKSARQRRLNARKQSMVSENEVTGPHSASWKVGRKQCASSECEEDRVSLSRVQLEKSGRKMSMGSKNEENRGSLRNVRSAFRKRRRKRSVVLDSEEDKGFLHKPQSASRNSSKKQYIVQETKEDRDLSRALSYASEIEPGGKEEVTTGVQLGLKRHLSTRRKRLLRDFRSLHASSIARINESLAAVTTLGMKCTKQLLTKEEELFLSKKMKIGTNLKATRIKLTEILGHEPSNDLWASTLNLPFSQLQRKISDAHRARDQMFISNLRLVFSVANKYTGHGLSFSDLVQEGALGLLLGLEKFDHTKGFRLSTYVHWWIWQGITRALAGHSRTVRLPAHIHHRLGVINRASEVLTTEGTPVSVKNLSHVVNMSEETVTVTLKAVKKMASFDKGKRWGSFSSEEETLHSFVADPNPESDPWVVVGKTCLREDVDNLLSNMLNQREQEIIRLHYGLDGKAVSLSKISHRFGITRERVRQIEDCAMQKLTAVARKIDFNPPLTY